jgi:hypothetical protein
MRRLIVLTVVALVAATLTVPALADGPETLDGPNPMMWLSDPDGVDGDSGIEQGDPIDGAKGTVRVGDSGARVRIKATHLEPGHAYSLWVVFFNDASLCVDGCNGPDLGVAGGGSVWADGRVAPDSGQIVFNGWLEAGAGSEYVGELPPPPFAFAAYEPGPNNEFHVVVRSHGPADPDIVEEQISTFGGGCEVNVGPQPGEIGDFPVPSAPGECGEIQLYVFTPPAS